MPIIQDVYDANIRLAIAELEQKQAKMQVVFARATSPDYRRTINANMSGLRSAIEALKRHQADIHKMIERDEV